MPNEVKQLFSDIANEMEGRCLGDTYEVGDHSYEMRLLNGEEANWRNSNILMESRLAALSSIKLPTLAMGIRKVDGLPVEEAFAEEWDLLPGKERVQLEIENKYARKWFIAEHFMQFLSGWPDYVLDELWEYWAELEDRRRGVQGEIKKSLGEASEKEENESSTEPSPSGDR